MMSFSAYSSDRIIGCEQKLLEFLSVELAREIEKVSRFEAQELSKKLILNQCIKAKEQGNKSIRIKDSKVRFSEFSYTYNTKDPFYFCKNQNGYKSYLSQLTQMITQFSLKIERKKYEEEVRSRAPTQSRSIRKVEAKVEKMWDCRIPNYIRTIRRVKRAQMLTLTNTYGPNSCVEVY
jgi:hypothetical protein